MVRQWAMEELVELVRGSMIVGRDMHAQPVRLPAALTEVAIPDARTWDAQLSQEYPSDYGTVVENWWRAVSEPGTPQHVRVRRCVNDRWYEYDVGALNLLHQDDLGCVLTYAHRLHEIDPPPAPTRHDGASFDAPHSIVQHLDELGIILRTEGDVEHVFGMRPEEIQGESVVEYLHPDDRDAAVAMWLEVLGSPDNARTIQQRIVRPDGSSIWIQSTVMNRLDTSGTILSMSHDVSAMREQQAALAAREAQLRFLTEVVPVGVFRSTADGAITFANARWSAILGEASSMDAVLARIAGDDRERLVAITDRARDDVTATIARVRTADDDRHLEIRLQGVIGPGGDVEVIGTVDDVTDSVIRTFELEARAERDALTGLANRRGLARTLEAAVVGARPAVVLFGDLDDFKWVNDEWGHDAGDRVLAAIGQRLSQAVRPGDVVGRWGGDEFVIICLDVEPEREDDVIDRLHHALAEPIVVDDLTYQATVSLGAVRPLPGESGEDVLRRADMAMYEAKRRGAHR